MKQRKGIPDICLELPSLMRRGSGFVRYSADDGSVVGVCTTLHAYSLSSVLRVAYQVELPGGESTMAYERLCELAGEANANGSVGTFSVEATEGHNTLRLLQLLWVEHRPTKESLEELLVAGEAALRGLYVKAAKGD